MGRTITLQKGVALFSALLLLSLVGFALAGNAGAEAAASVAQKPDAIPLAQRIEHVESGLLPPAVIQGETPSRMRLAERMKFYKTPGVSIAIINEGRIEWALGYGVLEAGGAVPVTAKTIFQAASISKPVAAMAALSLIEQKKLGLDEDVNQKLVSWKLTENEFTKDQKVTVRRILSHSAGITPPMFLGYAEGNIPTLRQILNGEPPANSAPVRVDMVPGSKWRYSGGGYLVLQQLMMDASQSSFPELMQKSVLQKLGMSHSTFAQPLPADRAATAAAGHLPDGKEIQSKWFVLPELAAAGLWSTPTDLARFAIEVQKSNAGKSNKVLSTNMAKLMLTPQIENSGLGLFVDGKDNSARFTFSGSNVGYKSYLVSYLNSGQGAVIMTNSENGAPLVLEILRSIAAEYGWPDYRVRERVVVRLDPNLYDAYVGEYEIAPGFILTVTREGDKLISQATGQPKSELFPESETVFFVKDADAQFTFVKNDKGQVVQVKIRRTTRELQARKIK